jgi:hemolysin III
MPPSLELQVRSAAESATSEPHALRPAGAQDSNAEERANYLTHGAGVLFSLVGVSVLLEIAAERNATTLLACSVYGITLVLMFASSTVYHAVPAANAFAKRALRTLDHSAIFLLIAGTYTALSLAVPRSVASIGLLSGVWVLSALGIAALVLRRSRRNGGPVLFYLGLSALVALALPALRGPLGEHGVLLLSAGGIVYALGVPFYLARRLPYNHTIWHAFVLLASALHFFVVLRYVVER